MAARTRSRVGGVSTPGTYRYTALAPGGVYSDAFSSESISLWSEVCNDTTMPRPYNVDHGLSITKVVVKPTLINGKKYINALYGNFVCNNVRRYPAGYSWPTIPFTAPNTSYYRTLALANLSPYRSAVNLPLFLFELRELPSMIRQLGRVLKKQVRATDVAGGYLAYSFGWAPLVSDLLSLFDLSKKIEDRKAYFRKLESGTRVKRQLGTITVRNTPNFITDSAAHAGSSEAAVYYRGLLKLEETQKWWFTANAKLRVPLNMSNADLHSLSRRQILGLRINPADLWDAIPWSWLIDYFTNIGDILEATRGMVSVSTTRMNLMCLSKVVVTQETVKIQDGLSVTPGFVYATKKQRFPYVNPTPSLASVPFFTAHMAGITGSLAVVKALKAAGHR